MFGFISIEDDKDVYLFTLKIDNSVQRFVHIDG